MRNKILQWLPLAVLLIAWEAYAKFQSGFSTMFSSPVRIITLLYEKTVSGDLPYHTFITAYESFVGLLFGLFIGCIIGFILVYFPKCSKIAHPYIIALSSIPTFALAPLMIIWFGTGLKMKIVLAFLSTVFITAFQTYEGANKISESDDTFFKINHATNKQRFWMLSFPASLDWVIQSLKLNAGFCVLGAFIGEFIASEAGLGYIILKASGLYDTTYVFAAIICIILLSLFFNLLAVFVNKYKLRIIRFATMKYGK